MTIVKTTALQAKEYEMRFAMLKSTSNTLPIGTTSLIRFSPPRRREIMAQD
jgi:hypothetical protein